MAKKGITLEEEFKKNKELKKEDLEKLKDWYSKQPHLPSVPDEQLVLFLHSCFYSIEFAKTTIDNYYTCRTHAPEIFDNRDVKKSDCKKGKKVCGYALLPELTPEGYQVLWFKLVNTDPSAYNFTEGCKTFTMWTDLSLYWNGTSEGLLIVMDLAGIVFAHFPKLTISTLSKILYYLQDAMPVRLKGLHYVNVVPFMDKILALMSPFLKKELYDMMHMHTEGIHTLYDFIPKKILPKEYGGENDTFLELHEADDKEMSKNQSWFDEESKQRVVESKRPGKAKNAGDLFGIEGSFKKLDID